MLLCEQFCDVQISLQSRDDALSHDFSLHIERGVVEAKAWK